MSSSGESGERGQLDRIQDRFTRTADAFSDYVLQKRAADAGRLADMAAPGPTDRLLDAACGPGTYALPFAPRVKAVVGLDYTPAMLVKAREKAIESGLSNVTFSRGDLDAIPFGEGSFDIVTCGFAIHHLAHPAKAVKEFARVLRSGSGRVAIMDIVVAEPGRPEVNNRIEIVRDPSHVLTHTQPEILRLVESAGLRVRAAERVEMPRSFNHWMHVAGFEPGDPVYQETRSLMEATFAGDSAGFHPQPPSSPTADFFYTQTVLYLIAEKP
ncbi:MAG TPA: methyltransferase domain-containing protein [Candidatus Acidoferrales bacterium]|nr:methyltransferase domain-containing protein [Candidatus Acidoferrales bacterium]